jgi:site-specific DNA-methyltransferase (adenine-specific)
LIDRPNKAYLVSTLSLDTIIHGDCLEILKTFPENSVDLIFADPPYNLQLTQELRRPNQTRVAAVEDAWDKFSDFQQYDDFSRDWLSACQRVLKDSGTLWVIGTYHNIFRVGTILQDLGFWILNDVIWLKTNPMPNFRGVRFTNAHETLIWAQKSKGNKYIFNHQAMKSVNDDLQMRSDWVLPICTGKERLSANGSKVHSTQKPEALLYRILLSSTIPGSLVLDPFFGSGTTGVVAKKLGRHFIGIERDAGYVKSANKRIGGVTPFPVNAINYQEPRNIPRVPFGTLLETGLLQPGQLLYFVYDETITAMILANGKIQCGDLTGSIHSVAKKLHEKKPVNGWECWLYEFNNQKHVINNLRQLIQIENLREHESNEIGAKD